MVKRIAVINDLSGFGRCSLTAAIPVISVMGVQACPLPTAVLSAQTGFGSYYIDCSSRRMADIADCWRDMRVRFDGIYSGFFADIDQIDTVSNFVGDYRDAMLIVDPVLGDDGRIYPCFDGKMCDAVRQLAMSADVITPNLTELCLLAGADYGQLTAHSGDSDYVNRIAGVGERLLAGGVGNIIVTGIQTGQKVGNLLIGGERHYCECDRLGGSYSGTGDIFASIIAASAIKRTSLSAAVDTATRFIADAVADTECESVDRRHGVNFEKNLYRLGNVK